MITTSKENKEEKFYCWTSQKKSMRHHKLHTQIKIHGFDTKKNKNNRKFISNLVNCLN